MEADDGKHEVHDDLQLKHGKLLCKSNVQKQFNLRSSSNSNYEKKKLDNASQELLSDMMKLNKNFECLIECFYTILDKIDEITDLKNKLEVMELRVTKLEKGPSNTKQAVSSGHVDCRQDHSPDDQANRIDRLEYISSERERENRLLQVVISHPSLDPDCNQLKDHIVGFLSNTMGMTGREIDTSMSVICKGRPHSVMITFSSRLFKTFLFAARTKER